MKHFSTGKACTASIHVKRVCLIWVLYLSCEKRVFLLAGHSYAEREFETKSGLCTILRGFHPIFVPCLILDITAQVRLQFLFHITPSILLPRSHFVPSSPQFSHFFSLLFLLICHHRFQTPIPKPIFIEIKIIRYFLFRNVTNPAR